MKRKRPSRLRIAGEIVELDAPGLKQVKRKSGVDLYWAKDESPLFVDYHPSTVRIHIDRSSRDAKAIIEQICQREQECLERWVEHGGASETEIQRHDGQSVPCVRA